MYVYLPPSYAESGTQRYPVLYFFAGYYESSDIAYLARGVEATDPKLGSDHAWQSWIKDPEGNAIELHAYTPQSWQMPHV